MSLETFPSFHSLHLNLTLLKLILLKKFTTNEPIIRMSSLNSLKHVQTAHILSNLYLDSDCSNKKKCISSQISSLRLSYTAEVIFSTMPFASLTTSNYLNTAQKKID